MRRAARRAAARGAIPVVLVSGIADLDRYRDRATEVIGKPFEPQCARGRREEVGGRLTCPRLERRHRPQPDRVREPSRALPLRTRSKKARAVRVGEKDIVRAGGDRQALRATSSASSSSRPCARPRTPPPATSASFSTACARRARAGSSRPRSSSARMSSRTACSPSASRSRARRCRCGTRRPSSRCWTPTPTARSSARSRRRRARRSTPTGSS